MGFSVSGSAAIVFAGLLIAFGMFHAAASDGFERVTDAQQADAEGDLSRANTAVEITSTSYAETTLTVTVENTGATHVSLNETDVIVDNEYETGWRSGADVAGNPDTWLWLPGQTLTFEIGADPEPNRVRVATRQGVADTEVHD